MKDHFLMDELQNIYLWMFFVGGVFGCFKKTLYLWELRNQIASFNYLWNSGFGDLHFVFTLLCTYTRLHFVLLFLAAITFKGFKGDRRATALLLIFS